MEMNLTPQASRILDCAQALIAVGGYNGFSYADISEQVGITKASIHHHFPKKTDLVITLLQRYRSAAGEGLAALAAQVSEPQKCLDAYLGWWAQCIADGTMPICICALLAAETPALPEEVAMEVRLHFAGLAQWLEGVMVVGVAARVFDLRSTPAQEAQAFMATVHGAMLSARTYGDAGLFQNIVGQAMERLQASKARKSTPGSQR